MNAEKQGYFTKVGRENIASQSFFSDTVLKILRYSDMLIYSPLFFYMGHTHAIVALWHYRVVLFEQITIVGWYDI